MKLMIIGHARHGKDTVMEFLKNYYGFKTHSASIYACEKIVMPYMWRELNKKYCCVETAYEDRVNYRSEWFNAISKYNGADPARLIKEFYSNYDVYCGVRSFAEFHGAKNAGLYDHSIWVDASQRLPPEGTDSMELEPWMADFIIDNNKDESQLAFNVHILIERLLRDEKSKTAVSA